MTDDERAIKELLLDESCFVDLRDWTGTVNVFDVLKSSRVEIRHSNVLAWLLNPKANHDMGDRFLLSFLKECVREEIVAENDQITLLTNDWSGISVFREWFGLDILIVCEKIKWVIAIENKIDSREHDDQLERYWKSVDDAYPTFRKIFLYLTPEGTPPKTKNKKAKWRPISYAAISSALNEILHSCEVCGHAKTIIENYYEIVRREIMEDSELKDICQRIYDKHYDALNLIFENVAIGGSPLRDGIQRALRKIEEKGKIIVCSDKGRYPKPAFHTKEMDDYFGQRHTRKGGTWGNDYLYAFWFDRRYPDRIDLRFEVAPADTDDAELQKINNLLVVMGAKKKTSQDVYGRIWNYGKTLSSEKKGFSTAELEAWVEKAVQEALNKQKEWLSKTKNQSHIDFTNSARRVPDTEEVIKQTTRQ